MLASTRALPPVWPDAAGTTRGLEFQPAASPQACCSPKEDESFYATLALGDALRGPADVRTILLARERLHRAAIAG